MNRSFLLIFLILQIGFYACAQERGYQPGSLVSDFKLKNVDNKLVSLGDYKNAKGYIIVFTCNTCPYAKAYEQRIIELHKKYAEKGFPVIAINPNDPSVSPGDSFSESQKRSISKNYPFAYLSDPDQEITKRFGATRTPHVFLLSKSEKGNKVEYIGAVDSDTENTDPDKVNYVQEAIEALSQQKNPATKFTKAIGCTIKWKKG